MTIQDAIGWYQSKLLVNNRFGLHGNQDEAARLALVALIEQEERLQNRPLTLEELCEMDGEPVWIERCGSDSPDDREWALVDLRYEMCRTTRGGLAVFELYGKTWLAYRHKPEEEKNATV